MRALRKQIVATNLTKYNVGTERWQRPPAVASKTVILVLGQVESDASIKFASPEIHQNMILL